MSVANNTQRPTLDLEQSIEINASVEDAYLALIHRMTKGNTTPNNKPMPMVLEQWPGGRWFRDLGEGQGHLWAFIQVVKPPTLLELHGPMFMSYAVAGHMQFRLTQTSDGTELYLHHQVIGPVEEGHLQAVVPGWKYMLEQTKLLAEKAS